MDVLLVHENGLNVFRVDELCDTNLSGYIDTGEETWQTVEVNTHKPGSLGALIGKRVYQYSTRASTTPSSSNDYTYTYDAVGNVQVIYKASGTVGQEAYFFTQNAFAGIHGYVIYNGLLGQSVEGGWRGSLRLPEVQRIGWINRYPERGPGVDDSPKGRHESRPSKG